MTSPNPVAPKTDTPATRQDRQNLVVDHICDHHDGCGYCAVLLTMGNQDDDRMARGVVRAKNACIRAAREERDRAQKNHQLAEEEMNQWVEYKKSLESTLAAERASRIICPECDRPMSLLSNGPVEYKHVCEFCEMLKENDRLDGELKAERASREQAEEQRKIEAGIVDRVWKALGITTYAEAKGKAIDELVADLRASRLQADTEQFNAGIEAAAEVTDEYRDRMSDPKLYWQYGPFRTTAEDLGRQIRKRSKPSVSPEQEKPCID